MKDFPHIYLTAASAEPTGPVQVSSPGLVIINSTAPPEFGGPDGNWSPETLLVASVADCFILTFRAIANASKFDWLGLECDAQGTLEKQDRVSKFTSFTLTARLRVTADVAEEKAERLLHMAEKNCLITNSLLADIHLDTIIQKE